MSIEKQTPSSETPKDPLDSTFLIPRSNGDTSSMVVGEVVRDGEGNPVEITLIATDGSGDRKLITDVEAFLERIDEFRSPELESIECKLGDSALHSTVELSGMGQRATDSLGAIDLTPYDSAKRGYEEAMTEKRRCQ